MCVCRYWDLDIHNEYSDICHLHALLCPGNGEVWLKDIIILVVASSKKGSTNFLFEGSS